MYLMLTKSIIDVELAGNVIHRDMFLCNLVPNVVRGESECYGACSALRTGSRSY